MESDVQSAVESYVQDPSPEKAVRLVEEYDMEPGDLRQLHEAYVAARELEGIQQQYDQASARNKWNYRKNVAGDLLRGLGNTTDDSLRAAGNLAGDAARYSGGMIGDSVVSGVEYVGDAGETGARKSGDVGEELANSAGRVLGETGRAVGEGGKGFIEGVQDIRDTLDGEKAS
ncbi:MAG: hypothetical protein ABEJ98_03900 [Candidatus Nanohaloarchaea archaeon]